jgi:hypothetical protein
MHIKSKELYNEAVDSLIDLYRVNKTQVQSKKTLDFLREFYGNNVLQPVSICLSKNNSCLSISCRKGNRSLIVYIAEDEMSYVLHWYRLQDDLQEHGKIKNNITGVIERLAYWISQGDPINKFSDISEDNEIVIKKEKKS